MKSAQITEIKKTIEELGEICLKIQYGQGVMAELYLEQDLTKISDFLASQEVLITAAQSVKDRLCNLLEGKTVTELLGQCNRKTDSVVRNELRNLKRSMMTVSQINLTNQRYLHSSVSHGQAILQAIFADSTRYAPNGEMRTGFENPSRTSGMNHERFI